MKDVHIPAEVSIKLTAEQSAQIKPLREKGLAGYLEGGKGMILGSVDRTDPNLINLKYIPRETAEKLIKIAYEELGEATNEK